MAIECICGIVRHWNCPACNAADAERRMKEMRNADSYVVVEYPGEDRQYKIIELEDKAIPLSNQEYQSLNVHCNGPKIWPSTTRTQSRPTCRRSDYDQRTNAPFP